MGFGYLFFGAFLAANFLAYPGLTMLPAVLLMLNEFFGKLSETMLLDIASSLGSDVPFFMYEDKAMVGRGSGSSKKRAEQSAASSAIENLFPDKK